MQITPIITALVLALGVTSCSTISKVVYRVDVPQGNYLEASTVSQLQAGMTRQQVQYLLGTPVLIDPFTTNTWYYVYLQQKSYEDPIQHTLQVNFNQQGTVTNFDLDKPLPDEAKQKINNVNITAPAPEKSSWWQFWK
ncbi:outer membrane protein assembly factor BamE [Mannheimia massilioguelmaensis]|uniref:outer membrane protein assembly factor BamE n=1 Tax=Mannheimia massilioguelmaensis TaxID=1604354 RepID=UPI0005CB19EA|nr:outer membrane protein assembly factor BamE [Mannheimia massilioguelmaensis]